MALPPPETGPPADPPAGPMHPTGDLDDLLERGLQAAFQGGEPAPAPAEPVPDQFGRYRVLGRLGHGGLGTVYHVRDPQLGREVALKVLRPEYARDAERVRRFREEARISSGLQHPGIVPVYEVVEQDGQLGYTMRIVQGRTLRELLRTADTEAARAALLPVLIQVCEAVAFAHERGVVHGDLTPANVMTGAFGEVQVLDWGMARAWSGEAVTGDEGRGRRSLGTPAYLSPEQARGDAARVGRPADVFGLGAILTELLTGRPPYVGESVYQVHQRAAEGDLEPARQRLRACGGEPELVELAQRCLQVDPAARPADAGEVAAALRAHQAAAGERQRRLELQAVAAQTRAVAERRARRLTVALALLGCLGVVAASLGYLWWRSEHDQRRQAIERRAQAAAAEARGFAERAGSRLENLPLAVAAAERAEAIAQDEAADPATRQDLVRLRADLSRRLAVARAEDRLRHDLEETRPHPGEDRAPAVVEADYRRLFAECGIDLRGPPAAAAAGIRDHGLRDALCGALTDWAVHRRQQGGDPAASCDLVALADLADAEPMRTAVRRAWATGELAELQRLARDPATMQGAEPTISLLGTCLAASGDVEGAIAFYRKAHVLYPESYALSHDLAAWLRQQRPPPLPEITALLTAAAAVRPRSAHARVDLVLALVEQGQKDGIGPMIEGLLELDRDYDRSWLLVGWWREVQGDPQGALDAYSESILREPRRARALVPMAGVLRKLGRHHASLQALRDGLSRAAHRADLLLALGSFQLDLGLLGPGLYSLRQAMALRPQADDIQAELGRGWLLADRPGDAIPLLREAHRRRPDDANVCCNLGHALLGAGRVNEGLTVLERGHALGQRKPGWSYPSAAWVERARRMQALLPSLDGGAEAARADPLLLAELAASRGLLERALALHRGIAAADRAAEEALSANRGLLLVRLAQQEPEAEGAPALLRQGRQELEATFTRLREAAADGRRDAAFVRRVLWSWLLAPELMDTRAAEPAAVPLAEAERAAWARFWQGVHAELERLGED